MKKAQLNDECLTKWTFDKMGCEKMWYEKVRAYAAHYWIAASSLYVYDKNGRISLVYKLYLNVN